MPFLTTSLPYRGIVAITGGDRQTFLQGLVSQDVAGAMPECGIYAALLTPQGKFLHDLFIIETGDALWLDCEAARIDDLMRRLRRYQLRSDVVLADISADYGEGIVSNASPACHSSADRNPVSLISEQTEKNSIPACAGMTVQSSFTFPDPRLPALGQRMMMPCAGLPAHDAQAVRAYDHLRLTLGVPDGSKDMIPEESILLEYNLEQLNAISFTKGCYVGQELTARTYHRALIKKRAFPVHITGPCPAPGAIITDADGKDAGIMRSSCDDVGLAVLKIEAVKNNTALVCDGTKLEAHVPEWLKV